MEIRRLEREIYAGRAFTARYRSNGYYDIGVSEDGFPIRYLPFAAPEERSFEDVFFSAWLEDPVAFGAFEGGELLGFAEGSPEGWNRRFRISNICVFDPSRHSERPGDRRSPDAGAGDPVPQRGRHCVLPEKRLLPHRL